MKGPAYMFPVVRMAARVWSHWQVKFATKYSVVGPAQYQKDVNGHKAASQHQETKNHVTSLLTLLPQASSMLKATNAL
jgi:hypothetical protein